MKLISAGAAGTVTGSCHLLELGGQRVLIDCGLFQGGRRTEALNFEPFPFDVSTVDAVLLTHGHLDHVGRLPVLIKNGYSGPIYTLKSTQKITEVILRDAARIQGEDFERALRKAQRAGRETSVQEPLFTDAEVDTVLKRFRTITFGQALGLGGVTATFRPAGHILGSAFIALETGDARVICSGDLGNRESTLQADAELPEGCDAVLIETTYGNRTHRPQAATVAEFRQVVLDALDEGGKIMIPSFALERTQAILYNLKRLQDAGELPAMPVFLDSPMATKMTTFYQECKNEFVPEVQEQLAKGDDPFEPDHLRYTVTSDESKTINDVSGQALIIAGSGMMSGGRILHHLKHNLWRKEANLIVVGYQAQGTLGRLIVDGRPEVKIFGDTVKVRAGVHTIGGFSAHADQDDLLTWLKPTGKAKVYMVHGEPDVMEIFGEVLEERGREAVQVERGRTYELG